MILNYGSDIIVFMINKEVEALLEEFLGLPEADQIIEGIDEFLLGDLIGPHNNRRRGRSRIAGRVFEEIAFNRFSQKLRLGQELIPPDATLQVFERIHPEAIRDVSYNSGLRGVSLPDGIVLNASSSFWFIAAMVEYKLQLGFDYRIYQGGMFVEPQEVANELRITDSGGRQRLGQMIHEIDPEIAAFPVAVDVRNYKKIYVVPQNSRLITGLTHPRMEVIPLDFTSRTFSNFMDLLIEDSVATR